MEDFKNIKSTVKYIAFDADDTLWDNEPYFRQGEEEFAKIMANYASHHEINQILFKTEIDNIPLYGYGVKAFVLSMIEAASKIGGILITREHIDAILDIGKRQIEAEVTLLPNITQVLAALQQHFRLIVATKGDLLDQHRKLSKSGLGIYFHHIEIMTEKHVIDYQKMVKRLDIQASELMMIGNSVKSDVLPILKLGGYAVHIPYHTTWQHEMIDHSVIHPRFMECRQASDLLAILL